MLRNKLQDELNILPISEKIKKIQPINITADLDGNYQQDTPEQKELRSYLSSLPMSLTNTNEVNDILITLSNACKTLDQAKAVKQFLDVITEKTYRTTFSLTASRGRVCSYLVQ